MPSAEIVEAVSLLLEHNQRSPSTASLPPDEAMRRVELACGFMPGEDYGYLLRQAGDALPFGRTLLDPTDERFAGGGFADVVREARQAGVPQERLPLCADNADYYCLLPDGSVELWSHDAMLEGRWSSLAEWIVQDWVEN